VCHAAVHLVERAQFRLCADEREECAQGFATHLLEEATQNVVVVQKVLAPRVFLVVECALQLEEELV